MNVTKEQLDKLLDRKSVDYGDLATAIDLLTDLLLLEADAIEQRESRETADSCRYKLTVEDLWHMLPYLDEMEASDYG